MSRFSDQNWSWRTLMENWSLLLDLVERVAARPRTYIDMMDAWRTSCPRLAIWEDALDLRFVAVSESEEGSGLVVKATPHGLAFLAKERPQLMLSH
jgi:hypothetical protein